MNKKIIFSGLFILLIILSTINIYGATIVGESNNNDYIIEKPETIIKTYQYDGRIVYNKTYLKHAKYERNNKKLIFNNMSLSFTEEPIFTSQTKWYHKNAGTITINCKKECTIDGYKISDDLGNIVDFTPYDMSGVYNTSLILSINKYKKDEVIINHLGGYDPELEIGGTTLLGLGEYQYFGDIEGGDNGIVFDESTRHIDLDSILTPLSNSDNGSLCFINEPTSTSGFAGTLFMGSDNNGVGYISLWFTAGGKYQATAQAQDSQIKWQVSTNETFNFNEEHHVCLNHNSTSSEIFVNGVLIDLNVDNFVTWDFWFNDATNYDIFNFGRFNSNGANNHYFNGSMRDIKIYNKKLTTLQIEQINNSVLINDSLIFYSELKELSDITGNGYHGQEFGNLKYTNNTPELVEL